VTHQDSVSLPITTIDPESLGNIIVAFEKIDTIDYIVSLVKAKEPIEKIKIDEIKSYTYSGLEAGKYTLEVIKDDNSDGRWTSGSLKPKRLPEKQKSLELENLKAGWDIETRVNLTELFDEAESQ